MIMDLLINLVYYILNWFFALLPKVETMPAWYTVISDNLAVLSALNAIPVISTILQIALLVLGIYITWQGVVFSNWIYNKIRGSG